MGLGGVYVGMGLVRMIIRVVRLNMLLFIIENGNLIVLAKSKYPLLIL